MRNFQWLFLKLMTLANTPQRSLLTNEQRKPNPWDVMNNPQYQPRNGLNNTIICYY